jgi:hypothetical protein
MLCGFAGVAARLKLNHFLNLSCNALSLIFKGKTTEEIHDIFLTQEDLTMVRDDCQKLKCCPLNFTTQFHDFDLIL